MAGPKYPGLDTLALHAGAQPDPATGARATPIYQTASFTFPDTDYAAALFNLERPGHVYSRLSNPTNAVLEERIAALDGWHNIKNIGFFLWRLRSYLFTGVPEEALPRPA